MAAKRSDQIAKLVKEVEALAKRLRSEIRKRTAASKLQKSLTAAAGDLRKRAAAVAGQVEKYVHELRKELESGAKKKPARARSARRRVAGAAS